MSSASDQIQMSQKNFRNNTNTSIDDLPDGVLAEIVCRLPGNKFVVRCKGVSKRWCTLVSDPCFIDRFVRLQSDRKIPIIRTLLNSEAEEFRLTKTRKEKEFHNTMNTKADEFLTTLYMKAEEFLAALTTEEGEEFLPTEEVLNSRKTTEYLLNRMTREVDKSLGIRRKPSELLTPLFERLMSCHSLVSEPLLVATCNDLVLCCASDVYQRDYFICNPYTIQWVPLPPPPPVYGEGAVGFICHVENAHQSCRCKVVRIPQVINPREHSFDLQVDVFSSETGRWRKSIVSFTQEIDGVVLNSMCYPYNGMLYWNVLSNYGVNRFFGFDPFMINTTTSAGIDHYKGRIIDFGDAPNSVEIHGIVSYLCVGVHGGRLRFVSDFDRVSFALPVWELEEEQDERGVDRSGSLILKCKKYSLDTQMFDGIDRMFYLWPIFDPNDEDIMYLGNENVGNFKCNIRTGEGSKMPVHMLNDYRSAWFQLITLPRWPTPVPRLPQGSTSPWSK